MDNKYAAVHEVSIVLANTPVARPLKEGEIRDPAVNLNFTEFDPIAKAFAPMLRELAFDVCDMAIVAFFQALAAGKPMHLLPVVTVGRMHHGSIFYDPSYGELRPEDLKGRKIGVRAYSQTTGMWVRGFLQEQYGVSSREIIWLTTEQSHVLEYENPDNVKILENASLTEMLKKNEVSAVIMGRPQSKGLNLKPLIADPEAAGEAWFAKHHVVPINHMVAVTDELAEENPEAVRVIYQMLSQGVERFWKQKTDAARSAICCGMDNIWNSGSLQLAMQYSLEQGLIPRIFEKEELFVNIPL